ncbi:efflux RND transporter permease subunit [Paenibacillus ginsengarvi]|uniref:Efflux RND transporter permease subunit n=1 Tax=Paenibacillus ginsengarvi TaxID=400777 RepID=A0A3B0CK37_9BACL|nr:efflux RND transporter permease subunit [Paenibacillus ginsengarvi]RKN85370.1 efflux RND transporter permease subunit [Paenibacillus ginsengarvi]
MGSIIRFSLSNKFAILILTLIVTAAGIVAALSMKKETIPNIDVPFLTVSAVLPGAAPQEVAEKLSGPLEQSIKNLKGVDTVTSTSMENVASLFVEYGYGINMNDAENELRRTLDSFAKPKGTQNINVSRISLNDFPVVSLSVSGEQMKLEELTRLVEQQLKPSLEGIEGAGTISVSGQYSQEVQIDFNRDKMNSLSISADTVKGLIQGSAIQVPLGLFEMENAEKTVVVDGNIHTLEDLKQLTIPVIPSAGGAAGTGGGTPAMPEALSLSGLGLGIPARPLPGLDAARMLAEAAGTDADAEPLDFAELEMAAAANIPTVKLSDIADVRLVGKAESISRTNGKESIGINVTKSSEANTVDVVNAVKAKAKLFEADHPGVQALVMLDQGKPIEESVSTMLNKAIFGAIFAIIVIMLFLRNIRTTMISIVSIPLSLLIALAVLKQTGITLNVMTLGAMTVAIGRVVDDSIVVIENNYRRMSLRSEQLTGMALIQDATKEMFLPILSSTLVTIAVFLPLGLVSGPIGQLFMPFALTMVYALLASLLVAITVVPALAHFMFRRGLKSKRSHEDKPGAIAGFYRRVLNGALNHKVITSIAAVVLLAASLALSGLVGVSFLPEEEEKNVMITYNPGPGKRLADAEATALQAEKLLLNRPGIVNLQYSVGGQNPMSVGPSKSALFFIQYESGTTGFKQVKETLIADLQKLDTAGKWGEMDFSGGFGGNKLSLTVFGDSLETIKPAVERIRDELQKEGSFEKIESSLSQTYEQYTIVADQHKLSLAGLTAAQLAMKLSPVRERPVLTEVKVDQKSYKVYENIEQTGFASLADIENTKLASPLGVEVPVKEVTTIRKGTSPNTITHKDGRLYVEVTAAIMAKDVGQASSIAQSRIEALGLGNGIQVEFGGVTEQINKTFTQLGMAMAAAVAIVYLLLVITFGGGLTPFAILFSLPFTVIGGLVALYLTGETISASAMMGALMLIGIVVTNAIVLLDRVLHKEREGARTREALLEAGTTRLRPILMTALATVGALLPLALGLESTSGSLISKGLGVTVIGGLISSTLLTLVIVPIVYEVLAKFRRKPERQPVEE